MLLIAMTWQRTIFLCQIDKIVISENGTSLPNNFPRTIHQLLQTTGKLQGTQKKPFISTLLTESQGNPSSNEEAKNVSYGSFYM